MKFENIHKDIKFNCVKDDMMENTVSIFSRMIQDEQIGEVDFQSHWEQRKYEFKKDQMKICKLKGISLNILEDDNEEEIRDFYKRTIDFKPKLKGKWNYHCKLKFERGAGVCWDTPNDNSYHKTFFKSDDFGLDKVVTIAITSIESYV